MERIHFETHKGKKILIEDFSHILPGPDFTTALDTAAKVIRSSPPRSVLALFDAEGAHFNAGVLGAVKEFVQGNTPHMKAAAVVGIKGLLMVALDAATKASGRSFKVFPDRQAALDWLVAQ